MSIKRKNQAKLWNWGVIKMVQTWESGTVSVREQVSLFRKCVKFSFFFRSVYPVIRGKNSNHEKYGSWKECKGDKNKRRQMGDITTW